MGHMPKLRDPFYDKAGHHLTPAQRQARSR